jgi:glycerol-3-phosphate acyltransferase PlsY
MAVAAVLIILLSYLLGSIPCGYIAGRLATGVDIRTVGDGNMGAANVFRVIGARAGIAVALADATKGMLAITIGMVLNVSTAVLLVSGLAAVIGHNWPIFVGFRGGRGESTTIGVLLALMPKAMLIQLGVAAVPFFASRNVVFASAFLFIPLPLVAWLLGLPGLLIGYSIALPCVVGLTHFFRTRQVPRGRAVTGA